MDDCHSIYNLLGRRINLVKDSPLNIKYSWILLSVITVIGTIIMSSANIIILTIILFPYFFNNNPHVNPELIINISSLLPVLFFGLIIFLLNGGDLKRTLPYVILSFATVALIYIVFGIPIK